MHTSKFMAPRHGYSRYSLSTSSGTADLCCGLAGGVGSAAQTGAPAFATVGLKVAASGLNEAGRRDNSGRLSMILMYLLQISCCCKLVADQVRGSSHCERLVLMFILVQ